MVIDECPGVNLHTFDQELLDNHKAVMEVGAKNSTMKTSLIALPSLPTGGPHLAAENYTAFSINSGNDSERSQPPERGHVVHRQ